MLSIELNLAQFLEPSLVKLSFVVDFGSRRRVRPSLLQTRSVGTVSINGIDLSLEIREQMLNHRMFG